MNKKGFKYCITAIAGSFFLLLLFTGYLQYRKHLSYSGTIHKEVQTILKIDIDAILGTMAKDVVFDLFKKTSSEKEETRKKWNETGLSIPANLFIYTVSSQSASTYFCSFPVSDSAKVRQFIDKHFTSTFTKINNKILLGNDDKGKITFAYTNNKIAFSYSLQKENTKSILIDILNSENMLSDGDEWITKLKKQKNHIVYLSNNATIQTDFIKDKLVLNTSVLPFGPFLIPDHTEHRTFREESTLQIWMNAALNPKKLKKEYSIGNYSIQTDSILKYYKNYADLEIAQSIIQQDTITTYEYDDDFEMTEIQTIKESKIPEICLSLKSDADAMAHYLKNQNIIKSDKTINREAFPLYVLRTFTESEYLEFSTSDTFKDPLALETSDYFFSADINFDKLTASGSLEPLKKYTGNIKKLQIQGNKKEQKGIIITGYVQFENRATKDFFRLF